MPTTDSLRAELMRRPEHPVSSWASPMQAKVAYAAELSASGLLPAAYRRNPANVLWAIEYGAMLSLSPVAAMVGVHVIEGKPTASAGLVSALVRRAGHRLRVRGTDTEAVAQIIRADDPEWAFESRWSIDRARLAGLGGKDVWKKYPAAMLKSRAITEAARDACMEVLLGMAYTAEELGFDSDHPAVITQTSGDVTDAPEISLSPPPPTPTSGGGESTTDLPHDDRAEGYASLAEMVDDAESLRAVWADAAHDGLLDEPVRTGRSLRQVLAARAAALNPQGTDTAVDDTDAKIEEQS